MDLHRLHRRLPTTIRPRLPHTGASNTPALKTSPWQIPTLSRILRPETYVWELRYLRYPARNKPSKSQSWAETFCQRHTIGPESYGNPVFVLTGRESVVISHACQCILNLELWPCQKKYCTIAWGASGVFCALFLRMASLDVFWRKQCHLPSVSWYFFVVLSVLRRNSLHPAPFFHATTFFLKVCLEKMVCNFRRWSLMVHAGPGGMDSQYSENGPNDRPSMVWAGGSDTRSPIIILQHAVAQGPNSGVLQCRKGRGTSIWAKDFTRLGSSPRPLFLLEPFQLQPRLARNLSASTCNSDFNSKRKHRRASGLICSWVQTLVEHAFQICMANLFCRTSQLSLAPRLKPCLGDEKVSHSSRDQLTRHLCQHLCACGMPFESFISTAAPRDPEGPIMFASFEKNIHRLCLGKRIFRYFPAFLP